MNALEEFHQKLTELNYDASDEHLINKELLEVSRKLEEEGLEQVLVKSEIERQAYALSKSFDYDKEKGSFEGLSWKINGTTTDQDGPPLPFIWPDISQFIENDFIYIEQRYKNTKNLYTKTEFGLVLYFKKPTAFSRHNDFKHKLCEELFELAKTYRRKIEDGIKQYTRHMYRAAKTALALAIQCKFEYHIKEISLWLQEIHSTWDLNSKDSLRILLNISHLVIENFKVLKSYFNLNLLVEQNLKGLAIQESKYTWGAIDIVNTTFKLDQKAILGKINYKLKKAQLYEQLADEAEGTTRHLAAVDFVETALRIYKELKDKPNVKRLEERYQKIRGTGKFGTIQKELDADHVKAITKSIDEEIEKSSPIEILKMFSYSPMFSKIELIKANAEEALRTSIALNLFSQSVVDKFGNTIASYDTGEEREWFAFLQTYDFSYQMGLQWLMYYFMQSFKAGKLRYDVTLQFFENTWLNSSIQRTYNEADFEIKPLDIITPPLKLFFSELDKMSKDNNYDFNYVVLGDSLALKIEASLRYMCEKLGIATFKPRPNGIVMEKNLDDLLADLKDTEEHITGFNENDRFFIKFVMSEKMGQNLRNKIAHGLLDIDEYSFENIVVFFTILLRISKYKFT